MTIGSLEDRYRISLFSFPLFNTLCQFSLKHVTGFIKADLML